jgi:hypothetical protein
METWGKMMARVRGGAHADFLPVTSDRTGFVKDSPEYAAFATVMEKVMDDAKNVLHRLSARSEGRVISRAYRNIAPYLQGAVSESGALYLERCR